MSPLAFPSLLPTSSSLSPRLLYIHQSPSIPHLPCSYPVIYSLFQSHYLYRIPSSRFLLNTAFNVSWLDTVISRFLILASSFIFRSIDSLSCSLNSHLSFPRRLSFTATRRHSSFLRRLFFNNASSSQLHTAVDFYSNASSSQFPTAIVFYGNASSSQFHTAVDFYSNALSSQFPTAIVLYGNASSSQFHTAVDFYSNASSFQLPTAIVLQQCVVIPAPHGG